MKRYSEAGEYNMFHLTPDVLAGAILLGFTPDRLHPNLPGDLLVQNLQQSCVPCVIAAAARFMLRKENEIDHQLSGEELFSRVQQDESGTHFGYAIPEAERGGLAPTWVKGVGNTNVTVPEEIRLPFRPTFVDCENSAGNAISMLVAGYPVCVGMDVWKQGYRVDADDWLATERAGGQPYGHALLAYKPTLRLDKSGRVEYGFWCWNPNGTFSRKTWGCCVVPTRLLDGQEMYACVSSYLK